MARIQFEREFSPLERLILSSNGYLQRILSYYFDCDLDVVVLSHTLDNNRIFRKVVIKMNNEDIYYASSTVESSDILRAFEFLKTNGIGQFLEQENICTDFQLLEYSKTNGKLHRKYSLTSGSKFYCLIEESHVIQY